MNTTISDAAVDGLLRKVAAELSDSMFQAVVAQAVANGLTLREHLAECLIAAKMERIRS